MRNSNNEKINGDETNQRHPDAEWLLKIRHWKLCGTLTFKTRFLDIQNDKVKDFFARLNHHKNGEYNWRNVPVWWRYETDKHDRLHVHFAMLEHTPDFDWLCGAENDFKTAGDLATWMKRNWKHGVSHYELYRDEKWLHYITKPNPFMNSCFTPPIAWLKREVKASRVGSFYPWLEHDFDTPSNTVTKSNPMWN